MINIYNIPLKGNSSSINIDTPVELRTKKNVNINDLNEAINASHSKKIDITKYKSIIITFWATWCPSCHQENMVFNKYSNKNNDTLIIGISVDKDQTALSTYKEKYNLNFETFYVTKELSVLFEDIMAVPTHFIIDVKTGNYIKQLGLLTENEISNLLKVDKTIIRN